MNMTKQVAVNEVLDRLEQTVNDYIAALEYWSLEQLLWKPAADEWSLGQMLRHLIQSAQGMHLPNVRRCLAAQELNEADDKETASDYPTGKVHVAKTMDGVALFQSGSFPAERIQVPPSPQYTPLQPDDKQQLTDGLLETVRQMVEVAPTVLELRAQALAILAAGEGAAEMDTPGELNDTVAFSKRMRIGSEQQDLHPASAKPVVPTVALLLPTVAHPRLGGLNAWEWFWLIEMHYRHHVQQKQRLEDAWRQLHG